tara:strand:- start:12137 stop:12403 length:267 start_codon:yes stop_codon:yes gene_type:complete
MVCKLCETAEVENWFGTWCKSCRKVKHYLNLYGDRVYEVLDIVLSRQEDKQNNKINEEIKTEIKLKEHNLRSNKKRNKSVGDETHIKK